MPRYRVPTNQLRAICDPLDGVKWGCGSIALEEIAASVQDGELEFRSWQEVNSANLTPEQLRTYHLKRLATLLGMAVNNIQAEPEPADRQIRLVLMLPEAGVVHKAWFFDGNHRVSVAYLLGQEAIELDIIAVEAAHLPTVLPGAVLIDDAPAQGVQAEAAPELNAEDGGLPVADPGKPGSPAP